MPSNLKLLNLWFKEYFSPCPPVRKKFREDDKLFIIAGHRGSPVKEIENTIPSFELALQEGANALEIDVSITKDGHAVLWHDWDPNGAASLLREAGFEPWVKYKPHPPAIGSKHRKKINELNLEDFRENFDYKERYGVSHPAKAEIPLLEDFFKWSIDKKNIKVVFVDVKAPPEDSKFAILILKILKEYIDKYSPSYEVVVETFELSVFLEMKKHYPHFRYSLDVEPPPGFILDPKKYSAVRTAIENNIEYAIAFRPRKITIANWTTFRRIIRSDVKLRFIHNQNGNGTNVERLIGCTINKPGELKCCVKMGIGGIQTDFPERLRKIAERYKRKLD